MAVAAEIQVKDKLYIDGEWVDPAGPETIDVVNASTEEVMGRIPQGTPADVDAAVAAARDAFEGWSTTPVQERAAMCAAISAKLQDRQEELAVLIASELGMPVKLAAMIQAGLPIMTFRSMPQILEQGAREE